MNLYLIFFQTFGINKCNAIEHMAKHAIAYPQCFRL